ncbi:Uracil phosphoribosyltransferase [Psilocybe cubensis]|uniref:Uracil phosphoribosyltransferase n=2 Tax=Psilocybe cubensis TaxID=181762 RepID=A0ACB8H3Z3_PSICU|nr:Uracil phosphoribosyltransferase [Psilocybe cubensis]KAH9482367.1 Uracil phosphoribosyltransferase [Psilocybe cubensis]
MSLFSVPGWTVPAAPVREQSLQLSKKRKRPNDQTRSIETASINVEKLMSKLADSYPEQTQKGKGITPKLQDKPPTKKQKRKHIGSTTDHISEQQAIKPIEKTKAAPPKSKKAGQHTDVHSVKDKKAKSKSNIDSSPSKPKTIPIQENESSKTGLTALQKAMRDKLDGARFRLINENLYKSDSQTAHQLMREDPQVFEEYHTGFRHQVLSWPTNPVEHYASLFSSYPPKTIIADLGCGDAALAKELLPKGLSVLSFDLVSDNKYVVEADVCTKIPLPGSEGSGDEQSSGEGQVVDVVVFALSLMGVNWLNSVREAWRILKPGGELHIAEVTSRFTDIEQFQNLLGSIGFRLKNIDDSRSSHFTLFEFVKVPRVNKSESEWNKLISKGGKRGDRAVPNKKTLVLERQSSPDPLQLTDTHILYVAYLVPMAASKLNILNHPLVNAELSKLRQESTSAKEFREGVETISLLLGYEATRTLEEISFNGQTPVANFTGSKIKPRIGLTPILRAGLGMTDALLKLFPTAPVYHLGIYREKVTLQPVEYYSKLPSTVPVDQVFILDPLIATGGTAIAAITMIADWGVPCKNVKLLSVLASEVGLKNVHAQFPDLEIWVAGVDNELTSEGIISPGLGDSGDRLYNTLRS